MVSINGLMDDLAPRTQINYRSTINAVNSHFRWTRDKVHYNLLNRNADKVLDFVKKHWDSSKASNVTNRLFIISSLMSRTNFTSFNKIKHLAETYDKNTEYTNQPTNKKKIQVGRCTISS